MDSCPQRRATDDVAIGHDPQRPLGVIDDRDGAAIVLNHQ
jgi:hypothetical protein